MFTRSRRIYLYRCLGGDSNSRVQSSFSPKYAGADLQGDLLLARLFRPYVRLLGSFARTKGGKLQRRKRDSQPNSPVLNIRTDARQHSAGGTVSVRACASRIT